ncbi:hypothetical protein ACLI1A_03100 [Flavobacterium sp. RHBU_3]|uniref:hypothetical protein n=1 Tax=Flavobacterium sp. RHBU_3 TaxID=3391184 RepID=UPI0039855787
MKYYIYCIAALFPLLFGCQADKKEPSAQIIKNEQTLRSELDTFNLGTIPVTVTRVTKAGFDALPSVNFDTPEDKLLIADSSYVKRVGDTLAFKTLSKTVKLVNNDKENEGEAENYANYTYYGYLKNVGKFVVFGTYWEEYDYLLIDNKTGDIARVCGLPVVSPDGKKIVSGNVDLIATFTYNGIELLDSRNIIKPIAARELNTWGPEEIKWKDNHTLFVKAQIADEKANNLVRTEYLSLTLK